jgi:4-amino-4-deoxy-L-arabinose transferase-like glycosyltransferase
MKRYVLIALIILFAGCIRFWQLSTVPPALNSDEVAIGYNAYSLLKTGRDEYNKPFPLTFRSFDDYKMPVYVYMVAGSMGIFGFSDFAVRFPSALFGALSVLLVYVLVRELFGEKGDRYAIATAFLLAVSPWSVMFSRSGYEANVSVFFVIAATFALIKGFRRPWLIVLSSVLFSLSIWTYHTCRIFVPLLLVGLAVAYRKELWKKKAAVGTAVAIASFLLFPMVKMTFSTEGQMRALGVSAFGNPDMLKRSITWTTQDVSYGQTIFTLFHNRRVEYVRTFLNGYFSHCDLNFLFGEKAIEKYRAPGVGLLYLFELPLLFIGAYMLIRKHVRGAAVVFWWLITAPIAAAFTLQFPHPVRTIVFLPTFQILAGVGIVELLEYIKRRKILIRSIIFVLLAFLISANIVYFFHQYFVHMSVDFAPYWYTGRKEMVKKLEGLEDQYDRIIISNKLDFPYIFFLYYRPVDPALYQAAGGTVSGGFLEEGNHFGKYEFRNISVLQRDPLEKVLFLGLPGEEFKEKFVVDRIYYPNGTPAVVFFR